MSNEEKMDTKTTIVIPVDEERIGAVIGSKGRVEKDLEAKLNVQIKVDTQRGRVIIISTRNNIDNALKAKLIIEAIAHGIPYEIASKCLENPDYTLEVIDILEFARSKRDLPRIKSRLIGRGGKIKSRIEEELGVKISIRNRYVAIFGKYGDVQFAKEIIGAIARGSKYGRILKKIEDYKYAKLYEFREQDYQI